MGVHGGRRDIRKLDSPFFLFETNSNNFYFIFILHAKTLGFEADKKRLSRVHMVEQNNPKINDMIPKHDENMAN